MLSVEHKDGRSGSLVFVRVGHDLINDQGTAVSEEQDIVYRNLVASTVAPKPAPTDAPWRRDIHPDPVLLFRYSALTFNSHRIHYDRPYATGVEGYPGLVVHGPLLATLLIDILRRHRPEATVTAFAFQAVRPLFDTADFTICGGPHDDGSSATLWARTPEGFLAMEANASLA